MFEDDTKKAGNYLKCIHPTYIKEKALIGHILRGNCFQKHVIEGKEEERVGVTGRRRRRRK